MTDKLFQPYKLRSLALPNRIVVSPMAQFSADREGRATDWHHVHYGTLAVSGAGLVILEATAVRPEGRVSPCCLGLWDDGQIDGLRKVVDFSRKSRGAFVGIQLAHAGRKGSVSTPWQGGHALSREEGGWPIWSSSNMPYPGREAPLEPDASQLEDNAELRRQCAARRRRRVRPDRASRRPRLFPQCVSVSAQQRSFGHVGRQPRKSHALPSGGLPTAARRLAIAQAARRSYLRDGLGRRQMGHWPLHVRSCKRTPEPSAAITWRCPAAASRQSKKSRSGQATRFRLPPRSAANRDSDHGRRYVVRP